MLYAAGHLQGILNHKQVLVLCPYQRGNKSLVSVLHARICAWFSRLTLLMLLLFLLLLQRLLHGCYCRVCPLFWGCFVRWHGGHPDGIQDWSA